MEYDKLDEILSRMSFVVLEAIGNAHSCLEIVGSLPALPGRFSVRNNFALHNYVSSGPAQSETSCNVLQSNF